MSIYKLLRASAVTTLLVKYRVKLFRVTLAAAFALVTSWGYGDVAEFLQARHPDSLWLALVAKNLIIYAALFYGFWQLRPPPSEEAADEARLAARSKPDPAARQRENVPADGRPTDGRPTDGRPRETPHFEKLDALADLSRKPALKSRREAILQGDHKDS